MAPELLPEQDEDDSGVELEIENLFTTHSDMYAFGMLCFQVRKQLCIKYFANLPIDSRQQITVSPGSSRERQLLPVCTWQEGIAAPSRR